MKTLGEQIRQMRRKQKKTIKDLATETKLSPSFISRLERNLISPSINSIKKISDALGISIATLFQGGEGKQNALKINNNLNNIESLLVVRKHKRRKLVYPGLKTYDYLLVPSLKSEIEFILSVTEPGGHSGEDFYQHEGEECILILQGEMEIYVGDNSYLLQEGDCINFKSTNPHKWRNAGDTVLEAVWAIVPPSY